MSILENNKLIAKFMYPDWVHPDERVNGEEYDYLKGIPKGDYYTVAVLFHREYEALRYHKSWEKLMSVIEKVESTNDDFYAVTIGKEATKISSSAYTVNNPDHFEVVVTDYTSTRIKRTYQAIIEFIRWYNENNGEEKKIFSLLLYL